MFLSHRMQCWPPRRAWCHWAARWISHFPLGYHFYRKKSSWFKTSKIKQNRTQHCLDNLCNFVSSQQLMYQSFTEHPRCETAQCALTDYTAEVGSRLLQWWFPILCGVTVGWGVTHTVSHYFNSAAIWKTRARWTLCSPPHKEHRQTLPEITWTAAFLPYMQSFLLFWKHNHLIVRDRDIYCCPRTTLQREGKALAHISVLLFQKVRF